MLCDGADLELLDIDVWVDSTLRVSVWRDHEDIYNRGHGEDVSDARAGYLLDINGDK